MTTQKKVLLAIFVTSVAIFLLNTYISNNKRSDDDKPIEVSESKGQPNKGLNVRPLTNITYERSAKRVERGRYLTTGVLQCFTCHTRRDWDLPGAPPIPGLEGSGGEVLRRDSLSVVISPNITPDKETGAGAWTDDMLTRAIREGVGHDGRALVWQMPSFSFRNLSDEDVASVVVYLRSIPAVHNVVPIVKITEEERKGIENLLKPLTKPVIMPDESDPMKKGKYLVKLGECVGCHTSHADNNPGLLGGGNNVNVFERKAISANITFDPSGISYGLDAFTFVIRTGKGGLISPIMPWIAFKNMTDDDLEAIYYYLKTFPPSQHFVTNQYPFTRCAICEMEHGLGDKNKRKKIASIKMNAELYDQYVGTYLNAENNWLYIISRDGDKLIGQQWENGPKTEMTPDSELHFNAPMWPVAVSFVKDNKGQIIQLLEDTDWGEKYEKIK